MLLISLLLAWSGCKKDAPANAPQKKKTTTQNPQTPPNVPITTAPAGPPATPASEMCQKAFHNMRRLVDSDSVKPTTRATLLQRQEDFLARCSKENPKLQACVAESKSLDEVGKCGWLRDQVAEPNVGLKADCAAVYDKAVALSKERGAPGDIIKTMEARRAEGITQCTRESSKTVACLVASKTLEDMKDCRTSKRDPKLLSKCATAYEHALTLVSPDKMQIYVQQKDSFISGCQRQKPELVQCLLDSKTHAAFMECGVKR